MPIGLTDILVPLGSFPLVEDTSTKGGFRAVANIAARDAIASVSRKAGMLVWAEEEGSMWQLGSDLTTWAPFSSGGGFTAGGDLSGGTTKQTVVGVLGQGIIDASVWEAVNPYKDLQPLTKAGDLLQHTEGSTWPFKVVPLEAWRLAVLRRKSIVFLAWDPGSPDSINNREVIDFLGTPLSDGTPDPTEEATVVDAAYDGADSLWVIGYREGRDPVQQLLWRVTLSNNVVTEYDTTSALPEGGSQLLKVACSPGVDRVWMMFVDGTLNIKRILPFDSAPLGTIGSIIDFPEGMSNIQCASDDRDTKAYFGGTYYGNIPEVGYTYTGVVYSYDGTTWDSIRVETGGSTDVTDIQVNFGANPSLTVVANGQRASRGSGGVEFLGVTPGGLNLIRSFSFPPFTNPIGVASYLPEENTFTAWVLCTPGPTSQNCYQLLRVDDLYNTGSQNDPVLGQVVLAPYGSNPGHIAFNLGSELLVSYRSAEYIGALGESDGELNWFQYPMGGALQFGPDMHLAGYPIHPFNSQAEGQGAVPVFRGNSFVFEPAGASGEAGGDLTGTYPDPVVNGIQKSPIIPDGLKIYQSRDRTPPIDLAGNVSGMAVVKGSAQVEPSIISVVNWNEWWVILKNGKGVVHVTLTFSESGGVDRVNQFYLVSPRANSELSDILYDEVNNCVWVAGSENFGEGRVWKIDLGATLIEAVPFVVYPLDFLCTGLAVDVNGQLWVNVEVVGGASYAAMLNPVTGIEITTITYDYNGDFVPSSAAMMAEPNGNYIWLAGYLLWDGVHLACAYQIEVASQTGTQIQVGGHSRTDPLLDVAVTTSNVYLVGRDYLYQFTSGSVTPGAEYLLPGADNPARVTAMDGFSPDQDFVLTLNGYGGSSISGYSYTGGEVQEFTPYNPNPKLLLPTGTVALDFQMTSAESGWISLEGFDEVATFDFTGMGMRVGVGSFFTVGGVDSLAGYQVPSNPSIYDIGKVLSFTGVDFKLLNPPGLIVGEIRAWTGAEPPPGWVNCDGQELSRSIYDVLNGLYFTQGYPFGDGDGVSTFNVPDARGRTLVGAGTPVAPLTVSRYMGDQVGEESVTLTAYTSGMPNHSHTIQDYGHDHAVDLGSHTHTFTGSSHYHNISPNPHSHTVAVDAYNSGSTGTAYVQGGSDVGGSGSVSFTTSSTSLSVSSATAGGTNDSAYLSTSSAYGYTGIAIDSAYADAGGAHENMQPSLVVNYIIYTGVVLTEIVPVG